VTVGNQQLPEMAGGFSPQPRPDGDQVSSIRRPVPPGEVGGAPVRREKSIMDIILGN
jgi:penicillin-binding protein 1A